MLSLPFTTILCVLQKEILKKEDWKTGISSSKPRSLFTALTLQKEILKKEDWKIQTEKQRSTSRWLKVLAKRNPQKRGLKDRHWCNYSACAIVCFSVSEVPVQVSAICACKKKSSKKRIERFILSVRSEGYFTPCKKKSSKKRIERFCEYFCQFRQSCVSSCKKKSSKKRIESIGRCGRIDFDWFVELLAKRNPQKRGLKDRVHWYASNLSVLSTELAKRNPQKRGLKG